MNTVDRWRALPLLLALCVSLGAHAQDGEAVRAELAKPLQAAQAALQAGQGAEALARVREAEALGLRTPQEQVLTWRMKGAAALQAGDRATALQAFEAALGTGRLAGADLLATLKTAAALAQGQGLLPATVSHARRYLAEGGRETAVRVTLVQALYQQQDYPAAARELTTLVEAAEAAGQTPPEEQLKLLAAAHLKAGDQAACTEDLTRLVRHHPRREYWADLVSRTAARPGFAERLQLDALRLARRVGALEDASEYADLAQLAARAGQPGEALSVLDEAQAKGLGQGTAGAALQRLRPGIAKSAADDRSALAGGEAAARQARDGSALFALGQALVSDGQTARGLALMREAQAKGLPRFPDDARLRLGVALLAAGQAAEAQAQWQAITATDGPADLVRLWRLVR